MLTSLYTGISGINAHMNQMSVVGNNIANMNTHGFKSSRTQFSDLISQGSSQVSGHDQVGLGVCVNGVLPNFAQGAFETTNNGLDLAIDGQGFFVVENAEGASMYTRAGQFHLDHDRNIVNSDGLFLQGYRVDANGNVTDTLDSMNVASTSFAPQATANVELVANLQSEETIPAAFDVANPDETSNFATTVTVYDSMGNAHATMVYFRKSVEAATGNEWEWNAVIKAEDAASGTQEIAATGTLTFDPSGALQTVGATTYPTGGFDFAGGPVQDQQIAFDFGTAIDDGGTGLNGLTQFASASAVTSLTQDGFEPGSLQGISIDDAGLITGAYSNGETRILGQVALAQFQNPSGLASSGSMLYRETSESGQVITGKAGNEGMGLIRSSTLELSNVDLASEFVRMITAQRGFQANSRVITTTDEVLTELVSLKR